MHIEARKFRLQTEVSTLEKPEEDLSFMRNRYGNIRPALAAAFLLVSGLTLAASDFLTEGVDQARTGWVRDEKVFTTANVGSTRLLWKLKLESTPRAMHNLFAPLVAERVETAPGPRQLAVVAGVSDDLFGIDVGTGTQLWHRRFDSTLA